MASPIGSQTGRRAMQHITLKATTALLKHVSETNEKNQTELLQDDEPVWLVITTKRFTEKSNIKPTKIPLRHPFLNQGVDICLFTKDPQKEYKQLLEKKTSSRYPSLEPSTRPTRPSALFVNPMGFSLLTPVIIPMLPKLIGKKFFERKKQPVPINLTSGNLEKELQSILHSTYMFKPSGTCMSIKIGVSSQSGSQIAENIEHAINHIVERIPKKWKNIQSLHIKTTASVSLPIFNSLPDEVSSIQIRPVKSE
ncbi:ribosomal protein L1 [Basidiobolus meristosporus CBS 931.73]|uniref:Ribosomal protein L1 n=1 Tax=Basidiobolus meristosporus CBS 931.73 TaxID=1314790 RepID=A0A1Y1VPF7_9FUNG|nr:ribosomal protein L1 [Basidiobolus meristosporus CBS 931.73]|eukprot:ORX62488.1 ribosomal protein L1 [Basidiobolus meristosporus CBS 931.73]